MSLPKAPDPDGPQPDDWNPRHWIAYQAWARGETRTVAAEQSGYSFGHIGRLVANWHNAYDTSDVSYRRPGMDPETREKGTQAAALANRRRWHDRREHEAAEIGATLAKTHRLLSDLVDYWADNVASMEPRDIRMLSRAMLDLVKTADQLAGVPDSTRAYVFQQNTLRVGEGSDGAGVDEHLLDGLLEGGGTPQDLLDAMDVITAGFLDAATDVVDVEEHATK